MKEDAVAKTPTSTPTPITYADAGVDITRANRTKQRIKYLAHKTFTRGVLSEINASRGAVRMPLPVRSTMTTAASKPHALPTASRPTLHTAESA